QLGALPWRRVLSIRWREIVNARLCAEFFHQPVACAALRYSAELNCFTFGIRDCVFELIAKVNCTHRARTGTNRKLSLPQHVRAETALFNRALPMRIHPIGRIRNARFFLCVRRLTPVEGASRIQALCDAFTATDTAIVVLNHDSISSLERRTN